MYLYSVVLRRKYNWLYEYGTTAGDYVDVSSVNMLQNQGFYCEYKRKTQQKHSYTGTMYLMPNILGIVKKGSIILLVHILHLDILFLCLLHMGLKKGKLGT